MWDLVLPVLGRQSDERQDSTQFAIVHLQCLSTSERKLHSISYVRPDLVGDSFALGLEDKIGVREAMDMFVRERYLGFDQGEEVGELRAGIQFPVGPAGDVAAALLDHQVRVQQNMKRKELAERMWGDEGILWGLIAIGRLRSLHGSDAATTTTTTTCRFYIDVEDHVVDDVSVELLLRHLPYGELHVLVVQLLTH